MTKINRDKHWLNEIQKFIEEIEIIFPKADDFVSKKAISYNLAIIGEIINSLSDELKEKNDDIPWQQIKGLRNKIIHEYAKIDEEKIKNVVRKDIPILKKQIAKIIEDFND